LIRAYVPATVAEVVAWHAAGAVPAGTQRLTVTADLRGTQPGADDEELEFLVTTAAHQVAIATGGRPAVLAVDVPQDGRDDAVPVAQWAAVFIDDLQWYAIAEVPHLE
jgi:hypothetical protein